MGLVGMLLGLALLMWLAYRGWSVLLAAPAAALLAAAISGEPLLAHWTQTFMGGAARFVMQWFPMFLLGGLFGKLMEDSRSISAIARSLTERLGTERTMLAVVLASAVVTYGGVSVFVAFFVLVPMAQEMFRDRQPAAPADAGHHRPRRLHVHDVGDARHAVGQQRHPDAVLRHHRVRGAGPRHHRVGDHHGPRHVVAAPRRDDRAPGRRGLRGACRPSARRGELSSPAIDETARGQATAVGDFDPAELEHGKIADSEPTFFLALLPLAVVIVVNFLMSLVVLPRLDFSFLERGSLGRHLASARVAGVWSVVLALAAGCLTIVIVNWRRLPDIRETLDAGANASVLPLLTVSSLVGFGAVVGALPAFATVRDAVLSIEGGPLVSLTIAMNALAGLTGTASGGMAIALNAAGRVLTWSWRPSTTSTPS